MRGRAPCLVVSCEHAGNDVPERWRSLLDGAEDVLASHRGWDPGTRELGERLAAAFEAPLAVHPWTRLLVEPNRSPHHRDLFSEFTRDLPAEDRDALVETLYQPHRRRVEESVRAVMDAVDGDAIAVHIGVHSFTPVWRGTERAIDVAWLYDPARVAEKDFCGRWLAAFRRLRPELRLRRNAPYRGAADGLTTHLRRVLPADRYLGIELEVSQRFPLAGGADWARLQDDLVASLGELL